MERSIGGVLLAFTQDRPGLEFTVSLDDSSHSLLFFFHRVNARSKERTYDDALTRAAFSPENVA